MANSKNYSASTIAVKKTTGTQQDIFRSFPLFRTQSLRLSVLLFVGAVLLYANTLKNGFAIDDEEVIFKNAYVQKGISGIPNILATPHLRGYAIMPNETYRPLSLVFFAIESEFFPQNPLPGHLFNILFFGLCVVLLFQFLHRLFDGQRPTTAFIASLVFAMHPIHTEVVANIKSFDSILCFCCAFAAMIQFQDYMTKGKTKHILAGICLLFLSLLSKEESICFVALVPLLFFLYNNGNNRRAALITAGTAVAALTFLLLRAYVLQANNNTVAPMNAIQNALVAAPSLSSKIATSIVVLGYYLKFMLAPYPLICDYTFSSIPYAYFTDVKVWVILTVYTTLIVTAIRRLRKFRKDPWALGILFFLVSIALFSNLLFLVGSQMSERFTFLPSVGFSLLIALTFEKGAEVTAGASPLALFKTKAAVPLVLMMFAYAGITVGRNEEWSDNYTLHLADLQKAPENSHLNYCVGYALIDSVYNKESNQVLKWEILRNGIKYLKRSVEITPDYANAQSALGRAYIMNEQYDSAIVHNEIALSLNPTDVGALNEKSMICYMQHDYSGAIRVSKRILNIDAAFAPGYNNIGLCYSQLKNYDSAICYLKKAIKVDANYNPTYPNLAMVYRISGNTDSADKYTLIARKYYPDFDRHIIAQR